MILKSKIMKYSLYADKQVDRTDIISSSEE